MESLLSHCTSAFSSGSGGIFAVFFFGGLAGSLTHCLTMCGPILACQSACGSCSKTLSSAAQWHYHFGRLLTYGAFGFLAALLSKQVATLSYWPTVSSAMIFMAGLLFILSAMFPRRYASLEIVTQNTFLRGALMSFMPCGLIYAALMMAATLANPWAGMVAMWLFVLGTMPVLLAASGGAALLAVRWQEKMREIGRLGMAFNGFALLVMAAKVMR